MVVGPEDQRSQGEGTGIPELGTNQRQDYMNTGVDRCWQL